MLEAFMDPANFTVRGRREARALPPRDFALPVDGEHKATQLKLLSFAAPHMRAFHLNWMTFCVSFCSMFAAAALIPIIRDALDLTQQQITDAGIAAVAGSLGSRILMGTICDMLGPRLGMALVMLASAPCVFGMALANGHISFTLLRFGIGFSLASFVACQYWTTQMFNVNIVGVANATTAGWGNLGGGLTQLLMPLLVDAIAQGPTERFVAWRWAFFVPGFGHVVSSVGILWFSQDLPDGNFFALRSQGILKADSPAALFKAGFFNIRTWAMTFLYAFSFGIELTINNIIVYYLYDQFSISLTLAGVLGGLFGLMNLFARSAGGIVSDAAARRFGMRGRIWALWALQTTMGALCLGVGASSGSLALTIVMLVLFSLFVQASEGTCFGIVPFVSRRSLGVVAGCVGAGGNAGAIFLQLVFFRSIDNDTAAGIRYMGVCVMCASLVAFLLSWPMWGGMVLPARKGATEEDYYLSEFSEFERAAGHADVALRFANEVKGQRLARGLRQDMPNVAPGGKVIL